MRFLEQGMQVGNEIARGPPHGNRRTPAQMIRVKKSSWTVISANPRETGNPRKYGHHSGF
jgi:hypothetical protein